jgi:hypothetical protein
MAGGGTGGEQGVPECRTESFDEHDYLVCPHQGVDWAAANAACEAEGAALVQLDSAEENAWLYETVVETGSIWIGANDSEQEDVFRWSSGDYLDLGFTNWAESQPNDNAVGGEDCVVLHSGGGDWNDVACDSTSFAEDPMSYVCEIP